MQQHIPFGSTLRFPAFYSEIKRKLVYDFQVENKCEYDEEQHTLDFPTLTFKGTEKIHGTNGAVCFNNQDGLWVQSNSTIIAPGSDNEGCATAVLANKDSWLELIDATALCNNINLNTHTLTIYFEWCGGNIMRGNSALYGEEKMAMVFAQIKISEISNVENHEWISIEDIPIEIPKAKIFNVLNYPRYQIVLDLNKPKECETELAKLINAIEHHSPIGKAFGHPDNTAEGIYWWTTHNDELLRMKTKGEKHGGKPKEKKTQNPLTDEQQALYQSLAETVTPVWRITQGITESGATSMQQIGALFKWINEDIIKEELFLLEENKVTFKDIQRNVTTIVKEYFIDHLKEY